MDLRFNVYPRVPDSDGDRFGAGSTGRVKGHGEDMTGEHNVCCGPSAAIGQMHEMATGGLARLGRLLGVAAFRYRRWPTVKPPG